MSATQQLINNVINNAIKIANSKSAQADALAKSAASATLGWSSSPLEYPAHTFRDVEPPVTIPRNASGVDGALYDSTYNRIMADFTRKFADFFAEFFPNECNTLAKAEAWMCKVLTEGGSGIRPEIEEQMWQRDRSRIMRAANTAGETVLETFAARGFPVPTGAMQHQVLLAQQNAYNELAASSRDRAIKAMELEIENIRFAVTNALDYRVKGIAAAAEYIRVLALGPQIASDLASASAGAQAQLISAASSYYNARLKVEEMRLELRNYDLGVRADRSKHLLDMRMRRAETRAQITASLAQSLGQQAGAALNAIHAQVGATLNDSL